MVLKIKISAHAVCIDPKKTNGLKKPPTKAELQEELKRTKHHLKMTKDLNDALLEEVEKRVKYLENKNHESETNMIQETEPKKTVNIKRILLN